MISFFRRALSSWAILGLLGLIMIAFIITGVGTPGSMGDSFGSGGTTLVSIGNSSIKAPDLQSRLENLLKAKRQEQPGVDMGAFLSAGALEQTLDQMINIHALEAFGMANGMRNSKRLIDGQIASIPAFAGATGKFDRSVFLRLLDERKLTERQLRQDIGRDILSKQVILPLAAGARVPAGLASPYAALMLEARQGKVAIVPSTAMGAGTPPTPQEISAYYIRNKTRYTVQELRVIRYATFDKARFAGNAAPTEAEITAAFNKNAAKYGARETRQLTQVIISDQAKAAALLAKAKAGASLSQIAKEAGVDALDLGAQEKASFANVSSKAVSDGVFAAPSGGIVGPIKSGLGWHIVKVNAIKTIPGQSLATARAGIVAELSKQKLESAFSDFVAKAEDAIDGGQTFDDVIKANGLVSETTPAVTASGIAPSNLNLKPTPDMIPILKDAFLAEPDDDPIVVKITPEKYALVDLDKVIPSAPAPLEKIRDQVAKDVIFERASREARTVADAIVAKANAGIPLEAAVAASGKPLPGIQRVAAKRIDLAREGQKVPPPLALLFSMSAKKAKVLEAPDKQGWFIVWLDAVQSGAASTTPELVAGTQQELSKAVGDEYLQQFVTAIKAQLKVKRNEASIASLKRSLTGAAGAK